MAKGADHVVSGGEIAPIPGFDRENRKCGREMGFSTTGLSKEQDRPSLGDEPEGGEIVDELLVHTWLEGEVELREGAPLREVRKAQSRGQPAVARRICLFGDDALEIDHRWPAL